MQLINIGDKVRVFDSVQLLKLCNEFSWPPDMFTSEFDYLGHEGIVTDIFRMGAVNITVKFKSITGNSKFYCCSFTEEILELIEVAE